MKENHKKSLLALATGTPIGCLGGLIGLGGAEFRLPVLVGLFRYSARKAVAFNLAVSIITLISSLIFRLPNVTPSDLLEEMPVIVSFIAGGMLGAYSGAGFSKHLSERALEKAIVLLLVGIGILLLAEAFHPLTGGGIHMTLPVSILAGVVMGGLIGVVSSLLGVAGGELIIPTLILLYGFDIKAAGTASILISLPTVAMGIARHSSNGAYKGTNEWKSLVVPMGIGSIIGSFIGGMLIGLVSGEALKFVLGTILIISAVKMFSKALRRKAVQ